MTGICRAYLDAHQGCKKKSKKCLRVSATSNVYAIGANELWHASRRCDALPSRLQTSSQAIDGEMVAGGNLPGIGMRLRHGIHGIAGAINCTVNRALGAVSGGKNARCDKESSRWMVFTSNGPFEVMEISRCRVQEILQETLQEILSLFVCLFWLCPRLMPARLIKRFSLARPSHLMAFGSRRTADTMDVAAVELF